MIGGFSRERNRLAIRVQKVIHHGEELGVDGVVVAPATMEVGVASHVDQNYLERFALPAAAAFVQGLGQAIAQSNATSVLGPLGSVTTQNRLNFNQQIGIGAGVAAAQIGSELQQSTPHGPTVILDVGSSVGVLFLTDVGARS
jgi:intracellular multiplication protein IcmE